MHLGGGERQTRKVGEGREEREGRSRKGEGKREGREGREEKI